MNEEKKVYSVIGTVTIGTDEYRDLIEKRVQIEKEKDEYYTKYWDRYRKVSELEEQNKKLIEQLDQLKRYLKDNGEQDKFELWIIRASRDED